MFPLIFIITYLHSHVWLIQSSPSLDCSFRGKGGIYNDPRWDLNWECSCCEVIVLTTILPYFIPLCLCQDIFPQGTSDLFFSWSLICSYPVSVFRDSPWMPDSWCWDRRESGVHWMFVTAVLYKIPADTARTVSQQDSLKPLFSLIWPTVVHLKSVRTDTGQIWPRTASLNKNFSTCATISNLKKMCLYVWARMIFTAVKYPTNTARVRHWGTIQN